ncbi:hypothetical protein [Egbenema bharatensis]|uniref:hypothetical protein n=1 Tax=Egbenema bharatensis TaxID=3463334 RepID=UPI003A8BEA0D
MIISDLSYLNEVEENISGGRGRGADFDFKKRLDVEVDVDVKQRIDAKGAFNELTFDLLADGKYGSGTEVVVEQAAVSDRYGSLSYQGGTVLSYAN